MKFVPVVVSTSLLLISAVSFAQSQPMTPAKSTTPTQDSNRSESSTHHKLTADEQKMASEQYAKLDTNKDGKLSAAEFNAMPKGSKDFGTLDSDKDGSLTTAEFSQHNMQHNMQHKMQ